MTKLKILAVETNREGELTKLFKRTDDSVEFKSQSDVEPMIEEGADKTEKDIFRTFSIIGTDLYVVGSDEAISKCVTAIGFGSDKRVQGWRTYTVEKK